VPGPGAAFFLPAATLAATFFLAQAVLKPENLATPFGASLQQIVMLGAVVGAIALARLDWRATLGLRSPGAIPMIGALLVGCGAPAATSWLSSAFHIVPDPEGGTGKMIEALVRSLPGPSLVLLVGVIPALAEEALFRGWTLRGLRSQMSASAAVVLSSVLFGVFHIELARIAFTTALGIALAFMALRSGSLWPGVLAHALNNGILVALAKSTLDGPADSFAAELVSGTNPALGIGGLVAVAAGLAIVWKGTRGRDSLPPGAARG
jgi:sodium transport system permease protein